MAFRVFDDRGRDRRFAEHDFAAAVAYAAILAKTTPRGIAVRMRQRGWRKARYQVGGDYGQRVFIEDDRLKGPKA